MKNNRFTIGLLCAGKSEQLDNTLAIFRALGADTVSRREAYEGARAAERSPEAWLDARLANGIGYYAVIGYPPGDEYGPHTPVRADERLALIGVGSYHLQLNINHHDSARHQSQNVTSQRELAQIIATTLHPQYLAASRLRDMQNRAAVMAIVEAAAATSNSQIA